MARTLPWQKTGPGASAARSNATSTATKRRKFHSSDEADDVYPSPSPRADKRRLPRSPSTSPPPEPPQQEYMHDGYMADDSWIMVEDEFLHTARLFTQHLHHAEYQRLKSQAKVQKASAIQYLVRQVTNPERMSLATRKALEAAARSRTQDNMFEEIRQDTNSPADELDSSDDDDEPFVMNPQLAGLMTRPARPAQKLSGLTTATSNTRAAAGFAMPTKSRSKHDRDLDQAIMQNSARGPGTNVDPGRLDGPSQPAHNTPEMLQQLSSDLAHSLSRGRSISSEMLFAKREGPTRKGEVFSSTRRTVETTENPSNSLERQIDDASLPSDEPGPSTQTQRQQSYDDSAFSSRIKERREARRHQLEEKPQSESTKLGEVPTFLI